MVSVSIDRSEVDDLVGAMGRHLAAFPGEAVDIVQAGGYEVLGQYIATVAVDTGFLRSSASLDVENNGLGWVVGPTAEYGDYVERGTSRMAPQPALRPAYDQRVPPMIDRLADRAVEGMLR